MCNPGGYRPQSNVVTDYEFEAHDSHSETNTNIHQIQRAGVGSLAISNTKPHHIVGLSDSIDVSKPASNTEPVYNCHCIDGWNTRTCRDTKYCGYRCVEPSVRTAHTGDSNTHSPWNHHRITGRAGYRV